MKLQLKSIIVLVLFSLAWALLSYYLQSYDPQLHYLVMIMLAAFLLSLIVFLFDKPYLGILFYLLIGVFTFQMNEIGVSGWNKIIILITMGCIFEAIFAVLKIEVHNIPMDIILGSAVSIAALPLFVGGIISTSFATEQFPMLFNMILVSFFAGLAGALLSFLVWWKISTIKIILKLKYG